MAISLPYVTNQTKTNISIQTKLAILPLIEKNPHLVHISSILPEFDSGNLLMNINTQGKWDPSVNADDYCSAVCPFVDPDDYYANVDIAWVHNDLPFCTQTC